MTASESFETPFHGLSRLVHTSVLFSLELDIRESAVEVVFDTQCGGASQNSNLEFSSGFCYCMAC